MSCLSPIAAAETTGIVFDVQRGSLHDGPGIRTTVFLKGCPLRCAWCHNPESWQLRPQLSFDPEQCLGCGRCASACQNEVHQFADEGEGTAATHRISWDHCVVAGACVNVCPSQALTLYGAVRTVRSIMVEVEKDRPYYTHLGGGLTLSGGEPTVQLAFAVALLRAARAAGISTCVETCGIGSPQSYAQLLPLTDVFLFDYKATGEDRHRELTGVPPGRIMANLRWLAQSGAALVLRCPLIPGINDTPEHFRAIAALVREYESIRDVQLLPYHDTGRGKYDRIGEPRPDLLTRVPDGALRDRWRAALLAEGCPAARLAAD